MVSAKNLEELASIVQSSSQRFVAGVAARDYLNARLLYDQPFLALFKRLV